MKICFTGNMFPFGPGLGYGGERILHYLYRELGKRHDVYLFAHKGCVPEMEFLKDFIPVPPLDGKTDFHYNAVEKYLSDHKEISFDVYQCNYFTDGWDKKALNVAPVYSELIWCRWCHIAWQLGVPPYNTVSYSSNLANQMAVTGCKTTMIHYGLPAEFYEPSFSKDNNYAVWIAKIEGGKAPKLAIELALSAGMKIVLMGPPYNPGCFQQEVLPYLNHPDVYWLRSVDDKTKNLVMRNAKVFISSNANDWTECFGITNIEALACGTPVIGFTRDSSPSAVKTDKIIQDGVNGYLLEYSDSNNLQEILDKGVPLLNKIDQIDRRECRASFEEHYTADLMARRYEYFYEYIQANGNTPSLEIPF